MCVCELPQLNSSTFLTCKSNFYKHLEKSIDLPIHSLRGKLAEVRMTCFDGGVIEANFWWLLKFPEPFPCLSLSALSIRWRLSRVGHRVHMSHHHQDTIPVSVHVCLWASHLIPPPCSQPRNPISHTVPGREHFICQFHTLRVKAEVRVTLPFFFLFFFLSLSLSPFNTLQTLKSGSVHMSHHQDTIPVSVHMCLWASTQLLHDSQFQIQSHKHRKGISSANSHSPSESWGESPFSFSFFLSLSPTLPLSHIFSAIQLWRLGFSVHMSHHEDTIGVSVHVYIIWAFTWSLHAIQSHEPTKEHFICQFTLSKWKLSCERVLFCFCFWWG